MKILVIGKTGQLGNELVKDALISGNEVLAPNKSELDITDKQSILSVMNDHEPNIVINTAAFHDVRKCEEEGLTAFRVNCLALKDLVEICSHFNSWLVSFSTDYVFDGTKGEPYVETDLPRPLQIYGLSKLSGEYMALIYPKSIIIRTCGLYGLQGAVSKGGNFVDKRIKDSEQYSHLEIGNDQTVSPTYTKDLSKAVIDLLEHPQKEFGIYHLVNQGYCTWYEFTKEIFDVLNIKIKLIPVDRKGRDGKMRRPIFSALRNKRAAKLRIELPDWKEALSRYLSTKYLDQIRT